MLAASTFGTEPPTWVKIKNSANTQADERWKQRPVSSAWICHLWFHLVGLRLAMLRTKCRTSRRARVGPRKTYSIPHRLIRARTSES
jgi:hypothetical protein